MHYLIALFDIKDSEQTTKTNEIIKNVKTLLDIVEQAFSTVPEEEKEAVKPSTGDGFFMLFKTIDYQPIFNGFSKIELISQNKGIRFRACLHIGTAEETDVFGQPNFLGMGMVETTRYNENEYLREAIEKNKSRNFCFGISKELYDSVKNESWFNSNFYTSYDFSDKHKTVRTFWLNTINLNNIPTKTDESKVLSCVNAETFISMSNIVRTTELPSENARILTNHLIESGILTKIGNGAKTNYSVVYKK